MATNTNAQRAAVLQKAAAAQVPGQPFVPTVQPKPPATVPTPAAPVPSAPAAFDWNDFNNFVKTAGAQFGGSSGGGGSVNYAPAGGAPQVNVAMPDDIASDQANLMHVDPKYQEQLDALSAEVAAKQG